MTKILVKWYWYGLTHTLGHFEEIVCFHNDSKVTIGRSAHCSKSLPRLQYSFPFSYAMQADSFSASQMMAKLELKVVEYLSKIQQITKDLPGLGVECHTP